jgi:hypothetical protein
MLETLTPTLSAAGSRRPQKIFQLFQHDAGSVDVNKKIEHLIMLEVSTKTKKISIHPT